MVPPDKHSDHKARPVLLALGDAFDGAGDYLIDAYRTHKPVLVHTDFGLKVGDERFVDDVRFSPPTHHLIRKGAILTITNPIYRVWFVLAVVIHTTSIMIQRPDIPRTTADAPPAMSYAIAVDRFLMFAFALDIVMSFVAHGLGKYVTNAFLMFDLTVFCVMAALEGVSQTGVALRFLMASNSLRPFRMIYRIRTMKNLVTVLARSSQTMIDVIVLIFFLILFFAVFGLTVFGPSLHQRCHFEPSGEITPWSLDDNTSIADRYAFMPLEAPESNWSTYCRVGHDSGGIGGMFTPCPPNYVCRRGAPSSSAWGAYDNMAEAMLTVTQVVTLEDWSQTAMNAMDGSTPFAGLYFFAITIIGSFWAVNLVLATITKAFSTFYDEDKAVRLDEAMEKERQQELRRQAQLLRTHPQSSDLLVPLLTVKSLSAFDTTARPTAADDGSAIGSLHNHSLRLSQAPEPLQIKILKAETAPETVPKNDTFFGNPFLRSRWRMLSKDLSLQMLAGLHNIRSVPVQDIAEEVLLTRRRDEATKSRDYTVDSEIENIANFHRSDSSESYSCSSRSSPGGRRDLEWLCMQPDSRYSPIELSVVPKVSFPGAAGNATKSEEPPAPGGMRTHTYYYSRIFVAEEVRRIFSDYVPKPKDRDPIFAFEKDTPAPVGNKTFDFIMQWRSQIDFDHICEEDFVGWSLSALDEGSAVPRTMVDRVVDNLEENSDSDRVSASGTSTNSSKSSSDSDSSRESIQSITTTRFVNIHKRCEIIRSVHRQLLEESRALCQKRKKKGNRKLWQRGLWQRRTAEEPREDDSEMLEVITTIISSNTRRLTRRGRSDTQQSRQGDNSEVNLAETANKGLFSKMNLLSKQQWEIQQMKKFISAELTRLTKSKNEGEKEVQRLLKRGQNLSEKGVRSLRGNLWLLLRSPLYSRIFTSFVLLNMALLLGVHYGQPSWFSSVVDVVSVLVDVVIVFDCVARVALIGRRRYFQVTTSNFYAFLEHLVVWFAMVDIVAVAGVDPFLRAFRVSRVFRFAKDWSIIRRIVRHIQSSLRHLLHLLLFLVLFSLVFSVCGWHIFANTKSESTISCRDFQTPLECVRTQNCVWVNTSEWLSMTNVELGMLREGYDIGDNSTSNNTTQAGPTLANSSSIALDLNTTSTDAFQCRQYTGWEDLTAGDRFNFNSLFSSFATVFTLITRDGWVGITYDHMENVSPFSGLFFITIVSIGGYVVLPLLVAILLVNFTVEETAEADDDLIRDALLLDEALGTVNDPELIGISEQLKAAEEDKRERLRLKHKAADTKARDKAAEIAASEEQWKREHDMQKIAKRDRKELVVSDTVEDGSPAQDRHNQWRLVWAKAMIYWHTFRETFVGKVAASILSWLGSFCDRKCRTPPVYSGHSLFLFPTNSFLRNWCRNVMSGKYFNFETSVFWIAVVQCVVTPLNQTSVEDESLLNFFKTVEVVCTLLSVIDMFIRCCAQCGFIHEYAYARESVSNAIDFGAVTVSTISTLFFLNTAIPTSVRRFTATLGCVRPLRIVVRSSSAMRVMSAIWFTLPSTISVLGVLAGAGTVFAIVGVELFQGRFKVCSDGSDRSFEECTGYWVAQGEAVFFTNNHTATVVPRVWSNPLQSNFDNVFSALVTLMEVAVASQWGDTLFALVDTPSEPGGSPERNQSPQRAIFIYSWLIFSNFFLLNIFVGTVVDRFRKHRVTGSGSFFADESEDTRAVLHIFFGTTAKISLSIPETPFISRSLNEACFNTTRSAWWSYVRRFFLFVNVAMMLTVHYGQQPFWYTIQFSLSAVSTLYYIVDVSMRIGIAGPTQYFSLGGFNILNTIIAVLGIVELLFAAGTQDIQSFQWWHFTWTLRVLSLSKELSSVRRLIKTGIQALPAMTNIGSLLVLIFYMFSVVGMSIFENVRIVPWSRDFLNQNLNFRTFPRAMFTLYRVATLDEWGHIVLLCGMNEPLCSKELGNCGQKNVARFYFSFFVITVAFVMLNLFIAVVLESFELTELIPDDLRQRESDVRRFRQEWGKFDPRGTNAISAAKFIDLLRNLPSFRDRLKELKQRRTNDPDYQPTDEMIHAFAKDYTFGLDTEDSTTHWQTLSRLDIPVVTPAKDVIFGDALEAISKLLFKDHLTDETTQRIRAAVQLRDPVEYQGGFHVVDYYAATVITRWWFMQLAKRHERPTSRWSRFLCPIFTRSFCTSPSIAQRRNEGKSPVRILIELMKDSMSRDPDEATNKLLALAVTDVVSAGSSDEDSDDSDGGAFPDTSADDTWRRRSIRAEMRKTMRNEGRTFVFDDPGAPSSVFLPVDDRLLLLQGRQGDGAQMRSHLVAGVECHMPSASDSAPRPTLTKASIVRRRPPGVVEATSVPADIWRQRIHYNNAEKKKRAVNPFLAIVREVQGRAIGEGRRYNGTLPVAKMARVRAGLLRFAKAVREQRQVTTEGQQPMFAPDATDRTVKLPTFNELLESVRMRQVGSLSATRPKSVPTPSLHIMTPTPALDLSSSPRRPFSQTASLFANSFSPIRSDPLPAQRRETETDSARYFSSRSTVSMAPKMRSGSTDWGGTVRSSRHGPKEAKRKLPEPGSTQDEIGKLVGIMRLRRFARMWRQRTAARLQQQQRDQRRLEMEKSLDD